MSAEAYDFDREPADPFDVARVIAELRATRDPNRQPFVQPTLDREARQELDAEDSAGQRRDETLRTFS